MENGKDIYAYAFRPHQEEDDLMDSVFIPSFDCYILAYDRKLWRKDINEEAQYQFISAEYIPLMGCCLRYSCLQKRLIINKDRLTLSVVNPETRIVEVELKKPKSSPLPEIKLIGDFESKLIILTQCGHLSLCNLNYVQRKGLLVSHHQVELKKETARSLAICNKNDTNDFLLVELTSSNSSISSRMILFQVNENSFTQIACLDSYDQKIKRKIALESFGYAKDHILWVGLSDDKNGIVQLYDFDTETGDLRELKEKRLSHQESYPLRLHHLNGKLYYSGQKGQLMCLSLSS